MLKISVIIPLYNKKNYITKCIESIFSQDYLNYEIIVVNDGSTDGSEQLIKKHENSNFKIINQTNQGVSSARNTGILASNGNLIAFLDADDYWRKDHLSKLFNTFEIFPDLNIYTTNYKIIYNKGYKFQDCNITGLITKENFWNHIDDKYEFVWTSASMFTRESLIDAGMFKREEAIGEDLALFTSIAIKNPDIGYCNHITVDYNRNADNNARRRIKVAYPKEYLIQLYYILRFSKNLSKAQLIKINNKFDRKITAYIFTLIMDHKKVLAIVELSKWKTRKWVHKLLLYVLLITPSFIIRKIYEMRLELY